MSTDEPAASAPDGGLVRLRIDLAYDGTHFSGWARQPGLRTVQGELERALGTVLRLGGPAATTVAGRTDAGVHARHQVAHADVPTAAAQAVIEAVAERAGAVVRRLNAVLPEDVRVARVQAAPRGFDARFSALGRVYEYRVCPAPHVLPPLRRLDTLSWPRPLDLPAMREAAAALVGEHDFAAYCRRREGATTVRRLVELAWSDPDADGVLTATVAADAFCHSMVRSLVGALLAVGDGRRPAGFPAALLTRRERAGEVVVAPPHGLVLVRVDYPPDDRLAARAAEARALRTLPPA